MTDKRTIDFLQETFEALKEQLIKDQERWGDTWKQRDVGGQNERIFYMLRAYYDQWKHGGNDIPWLKVMGLAHIAFTRINHPEELIDNAQLED